MCSVRVSLSDPVVGTGVPKLPSAPVRPGVELSELAFRELPSHHQGVVGKLTSMAINIPLHILYYSDLHTSYAPEAIRERSSAEKILKGSKRQIPKELSK